MGNLTLQFTGEDTVSVSGLEPKLAKTIWRLFFIGQHEQAEPKITCVIEEDTSSMTISGDLDAALAEIQRTYNTFNKANPLRFLKKNRWKASN